MVPTNRSAMAFARGARTGILMIRIPCAAKTASKEETNFVSRSCIKYSTGVARSASSTQMFRAYGSAPGSVDGGCD